MSPGASGDRRRSGGRSGGRNAPKRTPTGGLSKGGNRGAEKPLGRGVKPQQTGRTSVDAGRVTKSRGGRGGRGRGGRGGDRNEKKKSVQDLDAELDKFLMKDPVKAAEKLDGDLASYMAKPAEEETKAP